MRQKPPTKTALVLVATLTFLIALAGCAGYERWKELNHPAPDLPAPEFPAGKPVYPSGIAWLFEHDAVRYGQTPDQVKTNLEQLEPMCGIRFNLAPRAWPWVRPIPEPSFHGATTFQGHYHEVLAVYPSGAYVEGAIVFDQEDRAAFLYFESVFHIPFLYCLPGDDASIKEIRAKQPPTALEGLDAWLPVEAKIFDGMHHVRTKEDVQRLCAEALKKARPECWRLEEERFDIDATLLHQGEIDNLACMMGSMKADKSLTLFADDGFNGSFFPLFHKLENYVPPRPEYPVFVAYLANDNVIGVAMGRRLFPVLASDLYSDAAKADWRKHNGRSSDERIPFPTVTTFWKNN
jgi:hypothetical protein